MRHTGTQTIATERLTLRRFTIEDAENMYYNWASDPEVTRYLTWQPHKSVEETAEILQQWEAGYSKNEFYQWAIELNDIEQPIGSISVVSLNEDVQSAELGYCIGKSWWHQGYTTEAVEAVIRFLMAEVGAGRVWSQHDVANPNSGEVMKKAGMDYEGTLRQSAKGQSGHRGFRCLCKNQPCGTGRRAGRRGSDQRRIRHKSNGRGRNYEKCHFR